MFEGINKLLRAEELAVALGVTKRKVLDLTRKGNIPVIRLGPRTYRWWLADVLEALR